MVCVVRVVRNGLRRGHTADGKHTENDHKSERSGCREMVHTCMLRIET